MLLGATISLPYAINISSEYLPWISLFVIVSFFAGLLIGKILGINNRIAFLLSSGAAICGGTAMAAVAPIIKAKPQELLIAMSIVFLLNAIAIELNQKHPNLKTVFMSAERFMYQFIRAIRSKDTIKFKDHHDQDKLNKQTL